MLEEYRHCLLKESDCALSTLYDDKNLLKKMSEDEELQPRVSLCEQDHRTAYLDGIVINIGGIGKMFHGLTKDIDALERSITKGLSATDPRFRIEIPKQFVDEPNNGSIDFWFPKVAHNELMGLDDLMLDALMNHPKFGDELFEKVGSPDVKINAANCYAFLRDCAELRLLLFSAMHISYGSPARGTEILQHTLRNRSVGCTRNVQVLLGRLCFVGNYNKTSSQVSIERSVRTRACVGNHR